MTMAARVICDRSIAPLGCGAGALEVGNTTVRGWQDRVCAEVGVSIVDVPHGLPLPGVTVAFGDDVVFSAATLRRMMKGTTPIRALGHDNSPQRLFAPDAGFSLCAGNLQGVIAGQWPGVAHLIDEEDVEVIDVRPYGTPPHQQRWYRGPHLCAELTDWAATWHGLLGIRREMIRQPHIGRRCRIHPTALVRNSVLGDGCVIEAHASVINSVLGDRVTVAGNTIVVDSMFANDCRTLLDSHLRRVVSMSGATLSNVGLIDVIVGARAFMTTGVGFFPNGPGCDVRAAGRRLSHVGGAIGAGAVLGARALLRAGSVVPAGAMLVIRPDEAASKLTEAGLANTAMMMRSR
jgi:acetyltransferase-like isoleucine patch superfamily enzyme